MPGNHFESVLEALSFFPLLGRIVRAVWERFKSNSNKQPVNDIDISDTNSNDVDIDVEINDVIARNIVVVNQGVAGQNTQGSAESGGDMIIAPDSGTVVVIKQMILLLSREPDAVDAVQHLVSQYSDDSDLGYQVCRYAVRSLSRWRDVASELELEPSHSYWGALEQMIKDNQGRDRPDDLDDAEDDDVDKDA